jgi:hypothetical protein
VGDAEAGPEVRVPQLVVLDYVEGRPAQVADVAGLLAQRAGSAPVKVLLLARTGVHGGPICYRLPVMRCEFS